MDGDDGSYLMYGARPAWRPLDIDSSNGRDVKQLEESLKQLVVPTVLFEELGFLWIEDPTPNWVDGAMDSYVRIREALNLESGLNDGLCVPVLLLFIALALSGQGEADVIALATREFDVVLAGARTTLPPGLADARPEELPPGIEIPGPGMAGSALALARILHPEVSW